MKNQLSEGKDYDLWRLLANTRAVIFKVREKELSQYGITPQQAGILHILQTTGDKVTIAHISRLTFRELHTVLGLVNRMEKTGLVRKVKDSGNKNVIRVSLTGKGRGVYYQSINRESIYQILSSLSEEEQRQLSSFLGKLLNKACKLLQASGKPFLPLSE